MKRFPQNLSRIRILKNVFIICIGVLLLFTAYDGLAMLQSTMNREQGIGVTSQAIAYGLFCLSSIFLPNYVIKKLGSKTTYVISMCTYIPYIAYNFYPHWSLMIPTSILIGVGAPLLWGSQATYLNDVSVLYAEMTLEENNLKNSSSKTRLSVSSERVKHENGENNILSSSAGKYDTFQVNGDSPLAHIKSKVSVSSDSMSFHDQNVEAMENKVTNASNKEMDVKKSKMGESTTARFFGVHGMSYLSCHLWSNLMTYFVLQSASSEHGNATLDCLCGADYCNVDSKCFGHNIEAPSDNMRYMLTSVCVGIGVVGILLVAVFLDPLDKDREDVCFSLDQVLATYKMAKKKEILLLLPSVFYIGMAQGFYAGDFNKAYVGCAWGAYHVGLVAVCYGAFSGVSSTCAGCLVRTVGRVPIFSAAILVNLSAIVVMLLWKPTSENTSLFFVTAALWGVYVGVFWSQLRALHGILFKKDEEAAFAAFHVWYSLGFCVSFAYSNYLCTSVKLYIQLTICILGYCGYLYVERLHSRTKAQS